ncbi:hypothetical protein ACFE04_008722 [Oxalis oulophora]
MDVPASSYNSPRPPVPPKKSASFEFPAASSPQLISGEQMRHFSHPQHVLAKVILPDLFICAGCKEAGAGKGGIMKSKCDVCAKSTKGYSLRCTSCPFQMHPCCAMLSSEINFPAAHPHTLKLLPASSSSSSSSNEGSATNFTCQECNKKRSGRVYGCTECDYHLHTVCAKTMVNGLRANGIKDPAGKSSMFGTAARLASLVVVEFIGALIEGLGEGIGDVIVQNVIRGRGRRTNTRIN